METLGLHQLHEAITFMQEKYPDHPLTVSPNSPFCFYDTETTGLKGTGVLIFLNGIVKESGERIFINTICASRTRARIFSFCMNPLFWKYAADDYYV